MNTSTAISAVTAGAMTWFEIPTRDLDASKRFYECVLDTHLRREDFPPVKMAIFPVGADGGKGCLAEGPGLQPRDHGAIVYLAVPDIGAAVARWTEAGGRALSPILDLPAGIGRIAHMLDAEGGRVGLHEPGPRG